MEAPPRVHLQLQKEPDHEVEQREETRRKALQAESREMKLTVGSTWEMNGANAAAWRRTEKSSRNFRVKTTREALRARLGRFEADGDRAGGRDAFALGKRAIAGVWHEAIVANAARVEGHYGKRPQERPSRRGEISAIRTLWTEES